MGYFANDSMFLAGYPASYPQRPGGKTGEREYPGCNENISAKCMIFLTFA